MNYPQFIPGQKVETRWGEVKTVHHQTGYMVWMVEDLRNHYHAANLYPIESEQVVGEQKAGML